MKDIHIPLSGAERKHLILTGKNGSGKTSVLETLKNLFYDPERYKEWMSYKTNEGAEKLTDYNWIKGFILAYYSAKRKTDLEKPSGLNKIDFSDRYEIDGRPGKIFLQYIVNLKAEKSFARDDKDSDTAESIERWFNMFEDALRELFEDPGLKLEFDRKSFAFQIIQKDKEPFDFNTLADGYSAIIEIVTDLIIRMEKRKTKSYDVQGIVLIDEIEAHLHIDLQKKVLPFLIRFFPRIQFIVSTHSPFVLSSIPNVVIYDLEKISC